MWGMVNLCLINIFRFIMEYYLTHKSVRKWPSLEKILEESRKIKQELLTEKLLDPIFNLSLNSGSDISEITDPFEEFHKESFLKRQKDSNQYLTKQEADIKTLEQFTDDYKSVMNKLREEMKLSSSPLCNDMFETIENDFTSPVKNELHGLETNHKNENLKENCRVSFTRKISDQQLKGKESRKSSESNVWNILEAHTNPKMFQITPPGYNAYRDGKHWLERPHVEWEQINKSKLKVEKWLDKNEM